MAEIKRTGTEKSTGEKVIELATGEIVRTTGGRIPAVGAGIGSAAIDNFLIAKGVNDLLASGLDLVGADEGAAFLRRGSDVIAEQRQRIQGLDFFQAAQAEFPLPFFAGEMGGSYLYGGRVPQAVIGGLQGFGAGDTGLESTIFGSLGSLGGYLGGRGGQRSSQLISRQIQRRQGAYARARAEAAEYLESLEVGLRESDLARRGSTISAQRDRLRVLRDGDDLAIRSKRDALNEIITERILPGRGQDAITTTYRTALAEEVDSKYAAVRKMLPAVTEKSDRADTEALRLIDGLENIAPTRRGDATFWVDQIIGDYDAGRLTPERWSQMRSLIARDARGHTRRQEWEAAQDLYDIRQGLDNMVMQGNPEVVAALKDANELWRLTEVLESPNVINKELDISPHAFTRNLEKMFPDVWKSDSPNPEAAKEMYRIMSASEMFPAFRSSGTGEMLTASSLRKQLSVRAQLAAGSVPEQVGGSIGRRAVMTTIDAFSDIPETIARSLGFDGTTDEDEEQGSEQE